MPVERKKESPSSFGPSIPGLVTDIYWKYVVVADNKYSYFHYFSDFSSKSNGSIYYLKDCVVIFIESLFVFMNNSKKPRYPF